MAGKDNQNTDSQDPQGPMSAEEFYEADKQNEKNKPFFRKRLVQGILYTLGTIATVAGLKYAYRKITSTSPEVELTSISGGRKAA